MMRMVRSEAPPYLTENAANWTNNYVAKKRADASHKFRWPEALHGAKRTALNQLLIRELLAITADHCAYCDGPTLGETSRETIDHFRPKGEERFFHLAFAWDNLFPACDKCQQEKRDAFDDALLKPDEHCYDFDAYFDFNAKTGELAPNRRADAAGQHRAMVTIATFGLNIAARCASRLRHFERYYRDVVRMSGEDLNVLPYRYLALTAG